MTNLNQLIKRRQGEVKSKADIKNDILGIVSCLPYSSSEQDSKDSIKEIVNLLEKI